MNKIIKFSTSLVLIFLIFLSFNLTEVKAMKLDDWSYEPEWNMVYHESSYHLIDVTESKNTKTWNKISKKARPFYEYRIDVLHAVDAYTYCDYVAIIMDIRMSPNNISNDNCRSDLFTVTTELYNGKLVDGGPYSQSGVTTITTSGGIGLSIGGEAGSEGKAASGQISGNFEGSKATNKCDLSVAAYRQKIKTTDEVTRRFKVEYDYYDPYRNNIDYLESTSCLRYLVIYQVNDLESVKINLDFKADFIYDDVFWNSFVTNTTDLELDINVVNRTCNILD